MAVAVIPKVGNLLIHTGNIVNWNRLKGTVSQTASDELSECVNTTIKSWLDEQDRDQLQYATDVRCDTSFLERLREEERCELKITVKIFVSKFEPSSVCDAVSEVMEELGVSFIETVILSVPEDQRTLGYIQQLWSALEMLVSDDRVYTLGVSDLSKDQLCELYEWATVKPCINQVNLTTCCVIPPELTEFAKEHDIQLLTHNDPPIIMSDCDFQHSIASFLTALHDTALWQPSWVARYSVVIKCRGVIKSKGYVVHVERDICKLPYLPEVPGYTSPDMIATK